MLNNNKFKLNKIICYLIILSLPYCVFSNNVIISYFIFYNSSQIVSNKLLYFLKKGLNKL